MNEIFNAIILIVVSIICITLTCIFVFPIMNKNPLYVPIGLMGSSALIVCILWAVTKVLGLNW